MSILCSILRYLFVSTATLQVVSKPQSPSSPVKHEVAIGKISPKLISLPDMPSWLPNVSTITCVPCIVGATAIRMGSANFIGRGVIFQLVMMGCSYATSGYLQHICGPIIEICFYSENTSALCQAVIGFLVNDRSARSMCALVKMCTSTATMKLVTYGPQRLNAEQLLLLSQPITEEDKQVAEKLFNMIEPHLMEEDRLYLTEVGHDVVIRTLVPVAKKYKDEINEPRD